MNFSTQRKNLACSDLRLLSRREENSFRRRLTSLSDTHRDVIEVDEKKESSSSV